MSRYDGETRLSAVEANTGPMLRSDAEVCLAGRLGHTVARVLLLPLTSEGSN